MRAQITIAVRGITRPSGLISSTFYEAGLDTLIDELAARLRETGGAKIPVDVNGELVDCPVYNDSIEVTLLERGGGRRPERLLTVDVEIPDGVGFGETAAPAILTGAEVTEEERHEAFSNAPVIEG